MEPNEEFLTSDETCKILRISRNNFYALAQSGEIPAVRIGAKWRVNRNTLMAFLAKRTTKSRLRDKVLTGGVE